MVSHMLLCDNECYYQVGNDSLLINKKYKLNWYILISLFENNSLIRLGTSPIQCCAGKYRAFFSLVHSRTLNSGPSGPSSRRRSSREVRARTRPSSGCVVLRLVTGDLQLLERSRPAVFSRGSHWQQGWRPACCGVPLQQGSVLSHALLRQGDVTLACFSLTPWMQELLAARCPLATCFRCSTGKGFHL